MTIKDITNYNGSPHACHILAVLEVEPNDHNVATKIVVSNPRSKDDCSDTLEIFEDLLRKNSVS